MARPVLIINLKNYAEILGGPALRLTEVAESVASRTGVEIMVAPPLPSLSALASLSKLPVLSQRVDDALEGKSTGAVIPEALSAWGCAGSIINHSECRVPLDSISRLIARMKKNKLLSCVCAEAAKELVQVAGFQPEYIAVEPPELIGTGISVSKAKPELVSSSVIAARDSGYTGNVLCGAGITGGEDVRAAVRLGASGVLVASSIVKAADWEKKIGELAGAL